MCMNNFRERNLIFGTFTIWLSGNQTVLAQICFHSQNTHLLRPPTQLNQIKLSKGDNYAAVIVIFYWCLLEVHHHLTIVYQGCSTFHIVTSPLRSIAPINIKGSSCLCLKKKKLS